MRQTHLVLTAALCLLSLRFIVGKLRFREVEQPAQGYATMKGWDWDLDPETDIQLSSSGGSAGGGGEGGQ